MTTTETMLAHLVKITSNKSLTGDLTARQMMVLFTCYHEPAPQTVRGLSTTLLIAKPAITRAVDRLESEGLLRRVEDKADRRSVLMKQTPKGDALMKWLNYEAVGTTTKSARRIAA